MKFRCPPIFSTTIRISGMQRKTVDMRPIIAYILVINAMVVLGTVKSNTILTAKFYPSFILVFVYHKIK